MEDVKTQVYELLSGLDVPVYQARPETISEFPSLTFRVESSTPQYVLEREIAKQDTTVVVDIWGRTSTETTTLLAQVEEVMRAADWLLVFSGDVPEDDLSHVTTQFTY